MDDCVRRRAGESLDSLVSAFHSRILELQELVLARSLFPATARSDLAAVDVSLSAMESQVQAIRARLADERAGIPKAKELIKLSQRQQHMVQHMLKHMPAGMLEATGVPAPELNISRSLLSSFEIESDGDALESMADGDGMKIEEEPAAASKKGKVSAPRWYITSEELDSVSSYMRGRLTLEKVNVAINEIAMYADANAHLITNPKKKLSESAWERALELRDIAMTESVKGKHFFLESDIKGPGLKLDNTGKAILTLLRHLGRIQEARIGPNRVIMLCRPS